MARLLLPEDFDERAEVEAELRGYLSHARVQLDDGRIFPVFFVDPVRLRQELEDSDPPVFAEVGLIVVPDVTRRAMEAAVAFLACGRFFEFLRPLQEGDRPWEP